MTEGGTLKTLKDVVERHTESLTDDERDAVTAIRDVVARILVLEDAALVASVETGRDPTRLLAKSLNDQAVVIKIEPARWQP